MICPVGATRPRGRKEGLSLKKLSPEHEVSLRSAESVLNNLDKQKYNIFPVGITKDGDWILFGGDDYAMLPAGTWQDHPNNRRAAISPVHGQGLLSFENDCVVRERIDVVFPVLHGENGEDGSMQGLLQIAGIPYVGPHVAASAACMDKTITKLIADHAGVRQAAWRLVTAAEFARNADAVMDGVEGQFAYPVFVKPAGTGSSVGVSKARDREGLEQALTAALKYDCKVLVEEFIDGQEVEVAVLGNDNPFASVCGEIDAGADFYDYEAKYISDCADLYIPARISEEASEQVRETAVRVYQAMGCRGLSRVDFFVTREGQEVVFNEINTIPGFTSISMYPKLFEASGIPYGELLDDLKPVLIAITGTQQLAGEKPESIQLVTEGSYCCEPGFIRFSYVESEMTGMEGVVTSFTVEDEQKLTLRRVGKVNSEMVFVQGQRHESLYDAGMAALLVGVELQELTVLLNEHGGILDFSYAIDVERSACGTNRYHIEIREA